MTTLATMKARIVRELGNRTDLTTDIADAITTAINCYKSERLRWNETQPLSQVTFNTVAGTSFYGSATKAEIANLYKIDYLHVLIGSEYFPLDRVQPADIRLLIETPGTQNGQPEKFSYEGETLLLYPTPSQAFTILIGAHFSYAAPAADAAVGNRWMTDGELLIRSRAKYELALHKTRNVAMQEAMSPLMPPPGKTTGHAAYWELRRLKGEANRLTSRGRIAPMQF